jgi:hypothetical protein
MQTETDMRAFLITLLMLCGSAGVRLHAEVIDRILATVGGGLILQTDAVAMVRFGFVQAPAQADPLQWTLDRLIERQLMLIEVDRYGPPEPDRAAVDRRLQALDARIGSGERLDAILRETGYTVEQLRLYVRDELRIDAYVQQRFGATFQPSEDDLVRYYSEHPGEFTRDGRLLSFGEAREQAAAAVRGQLRAAAIRDWLSSLRRRTEVNVLYLPGR